MGKALQAAPTWFRRVLDSDLCRSFLVPPGVLKMCPGERRWYVVVGARGVVGPEQTAGDEPPALPRRGERMFPLVPTNQRATLFCPWLGHEVRHPYRRASSWGP